MSCEHHFAKLLHKFPLVKAEDFESGLVLIHAKGNCIVG